MNQTTQAYLLLDKFILSSSSIPNSSSLDFTNEHNAALSAFGRMLDVPLYIAVQENRFQAVKFIIQHGFTSLDDDLGYHAAKTGNLELVKLLDNPASVERCIYCTHHYITTTPFDMTGCLTGACESESMDIIDYLLETGWQINQDSLDMICEDGNIDILDRFIRHMTDTDNFSPLKSRFGRFIHEACNRNHIEIIKRLFIYGCDFTLTYGSGKTPFQVAVDNNRTETIELLTSLGITQ